jgi:acetate---CoA ligase (ADP-forming)
LEGPKEGRQFKQTIENTALKKPIVVLKPGRTSRGLKVAASHTASIAGSDKIFDAACKQYGLIREYCIESFFDTAKALATMPLPDGNRLFIITSSGGVACLTVDEAEDKGLQIMPLPKQVTYELNRVNKSPTANISNPFDLPSSDISQWKKIVQVLNKYNLADILLFVIADPIPGIEKIIIRAALDKKFSVAAVYMGGGKYETIGTYEMQKAGIPVFPTPERAIRSISKLIWYASALHN